MTILWNDAMSVGNVKIDNDHRYLIGMINTIEAALDCEVNIQILRIYVSELVDYTHKHFEREESYQVEIKFPHGESHKIEHKELLRQINCIHENVKSHTEMDAYQFTTPRLVDNLQDWLMRHILQDDMKMKSYFKAL